MNGLYPHQLTGVDWLASRPRAAGLFDEMGLGKTITAIAAMDRAWVDRVLVLAPTVVAYNWAHEIKKWSHRPVVILTDSKVLPPVPPRGVLIVTHGLLIRPHVYQWITSQRWALAVLDEAHLFRNDDAQRTRAFYGTGGVAHCVDRVWVLTGTPMPNHAGEMWPMLRGLWPDRCPYDYETFVKKFCVTAWDGRYHRLRVLANKPDALPELKAMLEGTFLRRLKRDHLTLPPIRWETMVLPEPDSATMLGGLNAKLRAVTEGLEGDALLEAVKQSAHFAEYRRLCGLAKVRPAAELLGLDAGSKVVVFAHHLDVIKQLAGLLGRDNCVVITGETSAHERKYRVDLFQEEPSCTYALCQITAGGVGITLTAASEVVFLELSWVPGDNSQAADRCHRIGQNLPVRVRVLALANSIDSLVADTLARKSRMIAQVMPT